MSFDRVLVMGLGKVGTLVATLLHETGFEVTGVDTVTPEGLPFKTRKLDVTDMAAMRDALSQVQAVVSALPFHLNLPLARLAFELGIHYFDLTEDVPTTQAIQAMGPQARSVMAPQCGLAPGFIGIVGSHLAKGFDRLRSIELRVGALPQHPRGKLGYAFNWSPDGVINEYINDCEILTNGRRKMVPALEGLETIFINGMMLEAFTTSGGLGTMCETYEGRVQELNYKTMRYQGHCDLMKFFLQELHLRDDRDLAKKIMKNALPAVEEDVVYVHAAVEGWYGDQLAREEFVRAYTPIRVAGSTWRAISWTTAAGITAVVEMVRNGQLPSKGFISQEDVPFDQFLKTRNGGLYGEAAPKV